jgi:glutamine cyclotransferase
MLKLRVLRELPHDPSAFTQGLLLHQGQLYESTGQYGQSSLRRWSQETGEVQQRVKLGPGLFGEGLALVEDRLIQLTWRRGQALVYDLASLRKISSFEYAGEGWGLTFDGAALVMSDGSDTLTFRDPESFRPLRHMRVRLQGRPLRNLNELEWAKGSVYANIWMEDWIARIDPATGEVTGVIDASGLLTAAEQAKADVLNGIAYDQESGRFVITGKLWPKAFEVELVPAREQRAAPRDRS